jgi:hypothetical protein
VINQSEIPAILATIIEVKKQANKRTRRIDEASPEYFAGYAEYVAWKDSISNHTVKGKKPVKLLAIKAPNQSPEELEYTVANYKQITLPVSFEFLSTIGRGLHDSNWSIEYAEDKPEYINADMSFKKYVEEDIASTPLRMSYDSWAKFVLPSIKLNDSMGVVGFKPYKQEATIINDEGEEVIAGDELPEPIPFYYSSDRVLSNMDWGYLLLETNNYSIIEKGGKKVREGLIFELWDDQNIWIIEQKGKSHEWEFDTRLYLNHQLGYIPATYLKGIAKYDDFGSLAWQSPFLMVTDLLDEVLLDGCNLRSVKASSVYPQKVMLGNDCQFQDEDSHNPCKNGYILKADGSGFFTCPSCNGTGMAQRTSPLNTLLVRGKSQMDPDGDGIKPSDALAYISPAIDTPKFLREEITQGIMNAMSILHLKTTNTVVQPTATDTTATGMVMDEKGKYAFIKSVVDQIFDIYEFGLECMGQLRYGDDFTNPFVNRPISYDFNTEGDYLNQISAAQAAGAPPVVIASYIYKYLRAIFYDNPKTARAYDLIIAADRLFSMTRADITNELPRNLIQSWEVVLHDSALTFIGDLVRENPNFLDQEMSVMIEQLKAKAVENTPASIAPTARLTPANILGNANA